MGRPISFINNIKLRGAEGDANGLFTCTLGHSRMPEGGRGKRVCPGPLRLILILAGPPARTAKRQADPAGFQDVFSSQSF